MNGDCALLLILSDHDRRVRFRKMATENFGVTVFSVAHAIDGLSMLGKIKSPGLILLSTDNLPLMTYQEFLAYKERDTSMASIPVVLLSLTPVGPLPKGVVGEVKSPISLEDLTNLIKKFCTRNG